MGQFLVWFVNRIDLYPLPGSIIEKCDEIDEDECVDMMEDNPYNWRLIRDL